MRARLEVFTVLPRTGMELHGQARPVVYGDSIIRGGSISGLSGTLRPDPLHRLDLIQREYCGLWWAVGRPRRTSFTSCPEPDTSKHLREICQSTGSRWMRIEPS